MEPGDIIFVLVEKKHELFKRNGNDLYIEQTIPLVEALCGFTTYVKHLDDRVLVVSQSKNDVINHGKFLNSQKLKSLQFLGEIRMITSEGMPIHKRPYEKGNLYIQFNIEFPKPGFLKGNAMKELEKLLPPRRHQTKPQGETEDVVMEKVGERQRGGQQTQQRRGPTADSDDEDEEGHGGQRVQCAQQ